MRIDFKNLPRVVAVVGSREFKHLRWVERFVQTLASDTLVVSGGAEGVDLTAENTANAVGLPLPVIYRVTKDEWYPPSWNGRMDASAGLRRNTRIIKDLQGRTEPTCVVAFSEPGPKQGMSKGTGDTVLKARRAGIPSIVYIADENGILDVQTDKFLPYLLTDAPFTLEKEDSR